jgi:hypothetical protein
MSKGIFWTEPRITVLENSDEARSKYGHGFGSDLITLGPVHLQALRDGKCLAWHDSEYSTFVTFTNKSEGTLE